MSVTKSFTAVGAGPEIQVRSGEQFTYDVSGTFVGTVKLEVFEGGGWSVLASATSSASGTVTADPSGNVKQARYRFRCSAFTSGTIVTELDPSTSEVVGDEKLPSGDTALEYTEGGPRLPLGKSLLGPSSAYSSASSYQPIGPDLELAAGAGRDVADGSSFLAPIMGNVLGATLTKTANYLAGVIGKFSVTGTKASVYPTGGVLGIIADNDTASIPDAPIVAVLDGDSAVAKAIAWFKARTLNSTSGTGADYGVDLYDSEASGLSYLQNVVRKALFRSPNQVCALEGSGAPVDGTTGDNFAAKGSVYTDYTNGRKYINTGTVADPVWKLHAGVHKVTVAAGEDETSTHQITVSGMAAGDEVVQVLVLTTAASIATLAVHAGTFTAAAGKITPGTEVNNTNNQYLVFWVDWT